MALTFEHTVEFSNNTRAPDPPAKASLGLYCRLALPTLAGCFHSAKSAVFPPDIFRSPAAQIRCPFRTQRHIPAFTGLIGYFPRAGRHGRLRVQRSSVSPAGKRESYASRPATANRWRVAPATLVGASPDITWWRPTAG
jgi:hypothetical protein